MAPQREAEEAPIHGDILEAIFSHVPLIHLVPACHVSKWWQRAVSSSLAHVKPIKPWLLVLTQSTHTSHLTIVHAYDPRSHVWLEIQPEPWIKRRPYGSVVRSSHSTLLYTLTPAEFAFSDGALHISWHHAPAPRVWRTDPIVARVGQHVVVAGGACEFEDDPLAVEMYDMKSRSWATCESMPALLKGSTGSTWLSVAVARDAMHVTEKYSGLTYSFNPTSRKWHGPYDLRPDQSVYYCVTGILGKRLVVAGLVGEVENLKGVKLWVVKGELGSGMEQVGEMPQEMVEKVEGGSVEMTFVGDFVYVRNTSELEELVVCELVDGAVCEWRSVRNVAVNGGTRMVHCGGDVNLEDLQKAMTLENWRFCLKQM